MVLGWKPQRGGRECEPRVTDGAVGPSVELTGSDDIVFLDLHSQVKAVEEEGAQVDSLEVAVQHHLCHSSPHGRGLLEPMATEARGKVHVDDEWVGTHHTILVKGVVVVIASPSVPNLRGDKMLGFPGRCRHTPPSLLLRGQAQQPLPAAEGSMGWVPRPRVLSSCEVEGVWQWTGFPKGPRCSRLICLLVTFRVSKAGTLWAKGGHTLSWKKSWSTSRFPGSGSSSCGKRWGHGLYCLGHKG